mmetsp:Transcript_27363/g.53080  ORF Transcript_27363/g.53080 Transcript_27363/m.53080 type:complete len:135 (-) Transcript_27363:247-651(-)
MRSSASWFKQCPKSVIHGEPSPSPASVTLHRRSRCKAKTSNFHASFGATAIRTLFGMRASGITATLIALARLKCDILRRTPKDQKKQPGRFTNLSKKRTVARDWNLRASRPISPNEALLMDDAPFPMKNCDTSA